MSNCVRGAAVYRMSQIAICGQLIVSCKSSCQAQHGHHAIGVKSILCNCMRYTVSRLENSFTGGMAGWGMTFKRVSCDNKWKTLCGLIKINGTLTLSWLAGGGGASLPSGQTLAMAVVGPKAIDRSKDLNVCTFQYVDNGLSFLR